MDEDDEIDILGDFNLESTLTSDITRLLSDPADYSLPSNWLLDFPPSSSASELSDGVVGEPVSPVKTVNSTCEAGHSDNGVNWSDREIGLLNSGLESFGVNWSRLAVYIGTKTSEQVKQYIESRVFESSRDKHGLSGLPCSLEESISVVETAKTTTSDRFFEESSPRKKRIKKRTHHYNHIKKKNFALNKNSIIFNGGNGEIVKLEKIDEDLITVDIDSDTERPLPFILPKPETMTSKIYHTPLKRGSVVVDAHAKYSLILQERLESVYSLPVPTHARVLDSEIVLDEEERIFPEFFPGQNSKNADSLLERYLKIRNHIVSSWNDQKPTYLTKTSSRIGLKSCGDVNLIGRIHTYLERKGVINFGCPQCNYLSVKKKPIVAVEPERESWYNPKREKRKKLLPIDAEDDVRSTGITIAHNENGSVTVTSHSENPQSEINNFGTTLIHCEEFTAKRPAPFSVSIDLRAILVAEMHSHSSSNLEVMGLLGGKYDRTSRQVIIYSAAPCVALSSSRQHCDMCPVSQFEANVWLQRQGHDVVGWYHSHPFALPEPSAQDISTQKSYQSQFVRCELPFLGLILSPYSCYNNKCFIVVDNKPYSMNLKTIYVACEPSEIVDELRNSFQVSTKMTDFSEKMPHGNKSMYRKCLERVKKILTSARDLPIETKNRIISEVKDLIGST